MPKGTAGTLFTGSPQWICRNVLAAVDYHQGIRDGSASCCDFWQLDSSHCPLLCFGTNTLNIFRHGQNFVPAFETVRLFQPPLLSVMLHSAPEQVIRAAEEKLSLDIKFQLHSVETSASFSSVLCHERKPPGKSTTIYDYGREKRRLRDDRSDRG